MLSFSEFFAMVFSNPIMFVTVLLALGVVLVNGWTDAPNAIATCVSTKCIEVRSAIILAAVMNFLGVVIMTMINSTVAQTIYNMVDFSGMRKRVLSLYVPPCLPLSFGRLPRGILEFQRVKAMH